MHIRDAKTELRNAIRHRLDHYPTEKRAAESRSVCRRILEILPEPPLTIAAYVPLQDETDIRPALSEILARGHMLFLPRFDHRSLTFRKVDDLSALLPGELRIPEPSLETPLLDPRALDIVLVPGRAFTREGARLGRGNGGYDRFIADHRKVQPKTRFYGVALECQIVLEMPLEEHDQMLDGVITARGL